VRKLLYGLLVLWGVVTLVFFIFSINPGDPARMLLGQRVDEASLRAVNRELGLDLPRYKQYLLYLNDVSVLSLHHSDPERRHHYDPAKYGGLVLFTVGSTVAVAKWPYLRRSYQSKREVSAIIADAMPGTAVLALCAIAFAVVVGIALGVFTALHKDTFADRFTLFAAVLGMSAPSFFSAIIISWLGGYLWSEATTLPMLPVVCLLGGLLLSPWPRSRRSAMRSLTFAIWGLLVGVGMQVLHAIAEAAFGASIVPLAGRHIALPGTGLSMTGSLYDVDLLQGEYLALHNLVLPAITLGIRPLAIVVQLTRNTMLDVLSQDYIRTARAKGLTERRVVWRHALRNALNPVVTAVSGWFASMLAGAVFIEFIFNWKGLGLQVFQSLQNDDFPVVMGAVLVIAATFVVINILVDILYGVLDPRVRLS
jgi:ABC-type dipeptide/oligopeptide/nickel transport system permease component